MCVSCRTYSYTWNLNYAQHNTQYTKKKPRTNIGLHDSHHCGIGDADKSLVTVNELPTQHHAMR